jgi:hypothetical protein
MKEGLLWKGPPAQSRLLYGRDLRTPEDVDKPKSEARNPSTL